MMKYSKLSISLSLAISIAVCNTTIAKERNEPSAMGAARVLEETYGWTPEEIAGSLGENLVRFYKANWEK